MYRKSKTTATGDDLSPIGGSSTTSPEEPAPDAAPGREQRRPPPGEQGEGCGIESRRACDAVFELGAKPQSSKRGLIPF